MAATRATVTVDEVSGVEDRRGRWPESITEFRGIDGLVGLNRNGTVISSSEPERFRAIRRFVPLDHVEIGSQRATPHTGVYNDPSPRPNFPDAIALDLVLSGRIDAHFDGRASTLSGTSANLLSMGTSAAYVARGPTHLVTVQVPTERIDPLAARWLNRPAGSPVLPSALSSAAHAFVASVIAAPPPERSRAAQQLERTMVDFVNALVLEAKDERAGTDQTPSLLFAEISEVIEDGAHRVDLTLVEVAAQTQMAPSTLERVLRMHGTNFRRLLSDIRIRRLAALLDRHPRASITASAADVGFEDPDTAARAFRQRYGIGPRAYRDRAALRL